MMVERSSVDTASFGYWLRRRRLVLDLTQAVLAKRVGCATATIKKIERDQRRPSRSMARRLADSLQIPDGFKEAFIQSARGEFPVFRLPSPLPEETFFGFHDRSGGSQAATNGGLSVSRTADRAQMVDFMQQARWYRWQEGLWPGESWKGRWRIGGPFDLSAKRGDGKSIADELAGLLSEFIAILAGAYSPEMSSSAMTCSQCQPDARMD